MEKKFRITVDGKPYVVTVEDISEGASLLYPEPGSMQVPAAGRTGRLGSADAERCGAARAPAGAGDVVSTLGGVVESIAVSVGQSVTEGDKVATIEAMKMKSPIIAQRAGKVASHRGQAGRCGRGRSDAAGARLSRGHRGKHSPARHLPGSGDPDGRRAEDLLRPHRPDAARLPADLPGQEGRARSPADDPDGAGHGVGQCRRDVLRGRQARHPVRRPAGDRHRGH